MLELQLKDKQVERAWKGFLVRRPRICKNMVNPQSELSEDGWEEDVMGDKADKEGRGQVVTTAL